MSRRERRPTAPPTQAKPWPAPRMLRITEVASTCDVSRNTVGKWIRAGLLDVVRIGAVVRITRQSFETMIARGSSAPPRGRLHG